MFDGPNDITGKMIELTPRQGLYGQYIEGHQDISVEGIQDYISSESSITLEFTGTVSPMYTGFTAVITEFTCKFSAMHF